MHRLSLHFPLPKFSWPEILSLPRGCWGEATIEAVAARAFGARFRDRRYTARDVARAYLAIKMDLDGRFLELPGAPISWVSQMICRMLSVAAARQLIETNPGMFYEIESLAGIAGRLRGRQVHCHISDRDGFILAVAGL